MPHMSNPACASLPCAHVAPTARHLKARLCSVRPNPPLPTRPLPMPPAHLALDVGIVAALAITAYNLDSPFVWPLYWFAQGTMFWALFVVGHDW